MPSRSWIVAFVLLGCTKGDDPSDDDGGPPPPVDTEDSSVVIVDTQALM